MKLVKRYCRAFSLIEIMVSLALVSVIVMAVGNIFDQASDSWHSGMGSVEMNNSGRAALDLIATELTQAFAGAIEHADAPAAFSNISFFQDAIDDISFVSFNQIPETETRELRSIRYHKVGMVLNRVLGTTSFNPYAADPGGGSTHPILQNVEKFEIQLYNSDLSSYTGGFPMQTNALPACADILIEVMPESAIITLAAGAVAAYRSAHIRVFSTRVYFRNRMGYLPK